MNTMNTEEHTYNIDELFCLDAQAGSLRLSEYLAEVLSEQQKQEFEDHLRFCLKCQEELNYVRWVIRQLKGFESKLVPLPVIAIYDWNNKNLIHEYYETPLVKEFAAAGEHTDGLTFPITVEYDNGKVIGEFWKRAGQFSFLLKKHRLDQEGYGWSLVYTSASDPSDVKTFELHEGKEAWLGAFCEFVRSNTPKAILETLKQFQVFLKRKDE